ncbi:phage GP46 family protein [Thalassolituus oleivorans]|jgi:phage gp46-like protein|uniref:Bacteriophage protein GP46 n=1 Tax=Thalassolituus oleivorans MIL-1 TaxID=1298593 RepID=M5DM57_9GAMM|nr:phage GP46 family protein [Thalassolituus oleivorans]CCU70945.1 Bacteriophage protein GP46 [Thalassolituus oleivorans MIL-1]
MSNILAIIWDSNNQRLDVAPRQNTQLTKLTTAIAISLFTDASVNTDELPDGEKNRGYWGDMYLPSGQSLGSKLWLLNRSKITTETINKARDYITEATQWMIDGSDLLAIEITVERQALDRLAYQLNCQLNNGTWQQIIMEQTYAV